MRHPSDQCDQRWQQHMERLKDEDPQPKPAILVQKWEGLGKARVVPTVRTEIRREQQVLNWAQWAACVWVGGFLLVLLIGLFRAL